MPEMCNLEVYKVLKHYDKWNNMMKANRYKFLGSDMYVLQSDHQSVDKSIKSRSSLSSLFLSCNISFC